MKILIEAKCVVQYSSLFAGPWMSGGELVVPAGTEFEVNSSDSELYFCKCITEIHVKTAYQQELDKLIYRPKDVRSKFLGIGSFAIPRVLIGGWRAQIIES